MKCIEVKENLNSFLDGEIDISAKNKIEMHLENCVSCKVELENLQTISSSIKQILPIAVPAFLDEKVLNTFENFHKQKNKAKEKPVKTGLFGIPNLAFATAFILLALFSGSAFQIGRILASNVEVASPAQNENFRELPNENFKKATIAQNDSGEKNNEKSPEIKIVEIPVIQEKIVEVPVIKEKIITRTVYVEKTEKKETPNPLKDSTKDNVALNSSLKDGSFLTQTNLKDFQPVSEVKARITKKGENE